MPENDVDSDDDWNEKDTKMQTVSNNKPINNENVEKVPSIKHAIYKPPDVSKPPPVKPAIIPKVVVPAVAIDIPIKVEIPAAVSVESETHVDSDFQIPQNAMNNFLIAPLTESNFDGGDLNDKSISVDVPIEKSSEIILVCLFVSTKLILFIIIH
jgi:hypothetical protein